MDSDRVLLGRCEEVMRGVLRRTGHSQTLLLPIMVEAIGENPGLLHLLSIMKGVEATFDDPIAEEVDALILSQGLSSDTSTVILYDIAVELVACKCANFLELVGLAALGEYTNAHIVSQEALLDNEEESSAFEEED